MKTEIRPASAADLQLFDAEMAGKSARVIAAVRGEQVLGVAGLLRCESGYMMFARLSEELKRDKRSIVRGIRALIELARSYRAPLFAEADPEISGSEVLLRHIGFVPRGNQYWIYKGAR